MKTIFTLFLILNSTLLIAQEITGNVSDPGSNNVISPFGSTMIVRNNSTDEVIKGHQYYEERDQIATVYIKGKPVKKCLVKYNGFNEEIEYLEKDKRYNLLKLDDMEVKLNKYSYRLFDHKGDKKFFLVYNKGMFSLGLLAIKKIREGKQATSSYESSTPSRYIENYKYFIINNKDKVVTDIKLKKKEILKTLGKKEELEKFAKSRKLSFKKESDLVKIIKYYNTLTL
ncbi:hypothetical protein [Aquimarina aquimarini]|uniref:hypothetical protein n=1 Tax=Aquimarina aquimarini TaxID=1191734 RepID=UPI000D54D869|nr:hypothetical protein [Aquimarina aquimarini]